MFESTITELKNHGLITEDDIVVACFDSSKAVSAQFFGGAIGAAIAKSKADRFLLAVNNKSVRVFDVDKNNGAYMGTCSQIMKDEILKAGVGSFFSTYSIFIKTKTEKFQFQTNKKFHHFSQKEALVKLKEFFKANF